MAELLKSMNYREIVRIQQGQIKALNDRIDGMKAVIIALFLAIIAVGVGSYMGYKDFKQNVKPNIEASYPVPVEQLKEI